MFRRKAIAILFVLLILAAPRAGAQDILSRLQQLPGVTVAEVPHLIGFKRSFKIMLAQPLQHDHPDGPSFRQQILLSHIDESAPVILVTEGYSLKRQQASELTNYFFANQINVEHRFFNESRPDSLQWRALNIAQAAADEHRIVTIFKKIYSGEWVSTGISKGGQTALIHRYFYPDDVAATVAYVAPIPLSDADPRLDNWITTLGGAECWRKMQIFQRAALSHRHDLISKIEAWSAEKDYTYSFSTRDVLDYAVLEYPFAFWQMGRSSCEQIPDGNVSIDSLFKHLALVVPFRWFSEEDVAPNTAAYYQFFTQLGFYHFMTDHVGDFFVETRPPTYRRFGPKNVQMRYDPKPMRKIYAWLQQKANNIIYIYGATDAWTGAAVTPAAATNSLKFVIPEHAHATRIRHFPAAEKKRLLAALTDWLDLVK